jgi:hypothetical protein
MAVEISMFNRIIVAIAATLAVAAVVGAQAARPTLADASPYVTKMNGGKPVDCTASKVKISFGSGRGEGYCQAVLADLTKSWENGVDIQNLDVLIPTDKMPSPPPTAYELKGDKLGSSMADYLQRHPNDCVKRFSTPPEVHHSAFTGNQLVHTEYEHVNAFRFVCANGGTHENVTIGPGAEILINPGSLSLATANMDREQVEFSHERLYLVAYYFKQDAFPLIQVAFIQKFGPPTSTTQDPVQNKLGAQFTRTTMTWKNGVSTIELSEMSGGDLTKSQVVMTLDEIYREVRKLHDSKVTNAVVADM